MNYELRTERQHLFAPNIKVIEKVDVHGVQNANELVSAIQKTCQKHQILNTYIKIDSRGAASYENIEKEQFIKVSSENWTKLAKEYTSKRFEIENGEMIKFFIIPKGGHFELLIIAHHLVGDGISIAYLIENIARTLNGEEQDYSPVKILETKCFPQGAKIPFLNRLYITNLNKKWVDKRRVFDFPDAIKVHQAYWDKYDTKMLTHQFTKSQTNAIAAYARKNNVTFNSLLTTIISDEYEKNAQVGIAVSVRNDYKGMANLVSGISVKYKKKGSLIKSAKQTHKSIYKKLNSNYKKYLVLRFLDMLDGSFLDSAYVHQYLKPLTKETEALCKLMRYGENKQQVGISNLAKLDICTEYSEVFIDNFMFIPPLTPYAKRSFGIATLNGEMSLSVHLSNNEDIKKEEIIFENIVKRLEGCNGK